MRSFLKLISILIGLSLIVSCAGVRDLITGKDQPKDSPPGVTSPEGPASAGGSHAYAAKKKVLFTQFDATNIAQLDDIGNPYDGLPKFIAKQLEADEEFSAGYVKGFLPRENESAARDLIVKLAREAGAQFLVAGVILDAGIMEQPGYLGTPIGRSSRRYFVIELLVYDGLTGNQLRSFRIENEAHGDVEIGRDKPIGSHRFGLTESGRALNQLMGRAATDIASIIKSATQPSRPSANQ